MNKSFFLLIGALTGALGCFGSDPNMNSMTFLGAGGSGTGTGGSGTGTAGASGNVTGPIKGSPYALFNTATEGFQLNVYHDTGNTNLGDPASGASPTLMFDSSAGSPDPGSLKVVAPYTGANQYVDIQKSMTNSPQDWRGKTLHVRLKVADGTYPGGAQVYVITVPNQYVFGGTFTNVAKNNNWQEFTVNVDAPMTQNSGYDPSQIIEVGVQLNTGSAGGSATTVTFNIDSFSIDPPIGSTGTGGAGGGAGGAGGAAGTTGTGGAGGTADASAGG
jgi:hypothetical protein